MAVRNKETRRRTLPAAVRDEVFARDGGRCTYVGACGIPCGSTHNLQIDHIEPFARGGSGKLDNLRLLCAQHNRLEAARAFGSAWMDQFRSSGANGREASAACNSK